MVYTATMSACAQCLVGEETQAETKSSGQEIARFQLNLPCVLARSWSLILSRSRPRHVTVNFSLLFKAVPLAPLIDSGLRND